jgi:outer membrane protein
MKTLLRVWLLLLALSAPSPAQAPPASDVLTLEQAVRQAVENSRTIRIAGLEVQKARDEVAAVRTRRLPAFEIGVLESQMLTRPSFDFPTGAFGFFPPIGAVPPVDTKVYSPRRPVTAVLTRAVQPLSQLHKIGLGAALQEMNAQIAEEKLRAEQRSVANNVKKLYFGILQAQSAQEPMAKALELYRELDRLTDRYLSEQAVLKGDSLEAKARLAKAEYELLALQNSLATLKEQLNEQIGRDIATEFRVEPVPEPEAAAQDIAALRARALEQRPEIKEARLKLSQAQYDFRLKKSEYLPDVSLAFHYLSLTNMEVLPRNVATVGVLFSWNPFDWGRLKHELAEKKKTIEQADFGLREAQAQVLIDAGSRYRKLQESRALLRAGELAEQVARERLRVAVEKYGQEASLLRELLQAQAALAEANHQYQQSLLSYWTARADLTKALGEE